MDKKMARPTYTSLAVPYPEEPPPPKRYYLHALSIILLIIINGIVFYQLFHNTPDGKAIFIDLSKVVNNRGFGKTGANFDGLDHYFTCPELIQQPTLNIGNVPFRPLFSKNTNNNDATARGQVITLPKKRLGALYLLVSVNHGPVTATHLAITYEDGSISSTIIDVPDWQDSQVNNIRRLDHVSCETNIKGVSGALFLLPLFVDPLKKYPISHCHTLTR
ncbi:hypothetical protein BCR42DRAFT_49431 [Absidia repens]|uniref:Uncharacterized protein n=1 Tax=Absidia repens TaxID=90262 RepID=A0A1X2IF23_9FUNG|nr:hypothetical protein BCR42DRAFT_49431 [Absidia repens]